MYGKVAHAPILPTNKNIVHAPLMLYKPFSLFVFLSFFSPIIVVASVVSLSFMNQNFKGIIYLLFLLGALLAREFIYSLLPNKNRIVPSINDVCSSVVFSPYGNATFSAFVMSFTMMYLFLPMFSNGSPNYFIFSILLIYFFMDIGIKTYERCLPSNVGLLLNILLGSVVSAIIVACMSISSSQYLFFNEISSDKEICSMPSKQTFKCNVFKNGELIGSV
jgi:hypothetical protein